MRKLDPAVWGPPFWFMLHTIALGYPEHPNEVTKRKYYDLIQNLPLFIPDVEMSNTLLSMLDKYPLTPYLDTRDSFIRWMWFVHNKLNYLLNKPELSLWDSLDKYHAAYLPKPIQLSKSAMFKKQGLILVAIVTLLFISYMYIWAK